MMMMRDIDGDDADADADADGRSDDRKELVLIVNGDGDVMTDRPGDGF